MATNKEPGNGPVHLAARLAGDHAKQWHAVMWKLSHQGRVKVSQATVVKYLLEEWEIKMLDEWGIKQDKPPCNHDG